MIYLEISIDYRLYSQLNTISRYSNGNSTVYCNQFVGNDQWSIYGISCYEFEPWPSEYMLQGGSDTYFYLYPTGDNRPYSDVILYGVQNSINDDFILSASFLTIENLVSNDDYVYRGILGECSSDPDPLNDGSFVPLYEFLNVEDSSKPQHIYTISLDEMNNYTMSADWQDLGISCYVPTNSGLYKILF